MTTYNHISFHTSSLIIEIKPFEKSVLSVFIADSNHSDLKLFLVFLFIRILEKAELQIRFICKVGKCYTYVHAIQSDNEFVSDVIDGKLNPIHHDADKEEVE